MLQVDRKALVTEEMSIKRAGQFHSLDSVHLVRIKDNFSLACWIVDACNVGHL